MDQKDQMTEKTKRRDKESYNFMDVPPILLWGLGHQLGSPFYPAELEIECQPLRQLSTPLLHKDVVESTVCPHQKAVSTILRITSKGHSWIDPGDDMDLTAIPLWVRV